VWSETPALSLIECIANMGFPTSTAFIPNFAAVIGPTVVPAFIFE